MNDPSPFRLTVPWLALATSAAVSAPPPLDVSFAVTLALPAALSTVSSSTTYAGEAPEPSSTATGGVLPTAIDTVAVAFNNPSVMV